MDVRTDSRVLKSALENGAPKLTAFLKTFLFPVGNTISALMFTMFRQVEIRLISLPEAGQMRIVCCQLAPGSKSNAFSGPARSISCPWIATASVIKWVCTYLILRLVQLQNLVVSTSSPIFSLWITISMCSRHLSQ